MQNLTMNKLSSIAALAGLAFVAPAANAEQAQGLTFNQAAAADVSYGSDDGAWDPNLAVEFGFDVYNHYYYRGIYQEHDGVQFQPWVDFSGDLFSVGDTDVTFNVGVWNSMHSEEDLANPNNDVDWWYEADIYAGIGFGLGDFDFGVTYTYYSSPSDAFSDVEEVAVSIAYDDSELEILPFALSPYATVAFELDGTSAFGSEEGIYLELGIEPGFDIEEVEGLSVSFPVAVGISLDNYYEAGTDDDAFGFASVGVVFGYDLASNVSLSAGAHGLFLGDNTGDTAEAAGGEDVEFVFHGGISFAF